VWKPEHEVVRKGGVGGGGGGGGGGGWRGMIA